MTTTITATPDTPRGPVDIVATCDVVPVTLSISRAPDDTVIGTVSGVGTLTVSNDVPGYGQIVYTATADLGGGVIETAVAVAQVVNPAEPQTDADPLTTCVTVQAVGTGATGESMRLYRVTEEGGTEKVRNGYVETVDPSVVYTFVDCEAPLFGAFGYCVTHWQSVVTLTYGQLLVQCPLYSDIPDRYVFYADFFRMAEPPVPEEPCSTMYTQEPECQVWLKNPYHPELNIGLCCVVRLPERQYAPNAVVPRPYGQRLSVAVWDVRSEWRGNIEFMSYTVEEELRLRAILADGSPVLLQSTSDWGAYQDWVQPDLVQEKQVGWTGLPERVWSFAMVAVQPPGDSELLEPSQAEFDSLEARVDDLETEVFGAPQG